MPPSVMILGCGRSGTSIFGELFQHCSVYRYRSEPPFADVMGADFSQPLAFKVPRESPGFAADPGLSFPLDTLLAKAPETRIFWIVRHPLDAVCSLRVGIARDWGHHPKPPDWRAWSDRSLVEKCAHHWTYLNSVGFTRVADRAVVVHFEDMIADPAAFTSAICREIGLDRRDHEAELSDWERRVQDSNTADFVEAATSRAYSRPDHSVRVGRWRENLSDDEVAQAAAIAGETGRSFGYAVP